MYMFTSYGHIWKSNKNTDSMMILAWLCWLNRYSVKCYYLQWYFQLQVTRFKKKLSEIELFYERSINNKPCCYLHLYFQLQAARFICNKNLGNIELFMNGGSTKICYLTKVNRACLYLTKVHRADGESFMQSIFNPLTAKLFNWNS